MIIVKILGGLGNQMFQYALYHNLKREGFPVKIDIDSFDSYELHNGFEIDRIFELSYERASQREISLLADNDKGTISRVRRKILGRKKTYLRESDYSSVSLTRHRDIYLDGYWQSESYFVKYDDEMRRLFTPRSEIYGKNRECLDKYKDRNKVSLHIRRGDYISNTKALSSYGNLCNMDYYERGIDMIKKRVSNPVFFVFSDDIPWCKRELPSELEAIFIDWNHGEDSYWDMFLMAECNHNIIANSSFSWWGAWLNRNKGKIVIAPDKWKRGFDVNTNRIPASWSRIPVSEA